MGQCFSAFQKIILNLNQPTPEQIALARLDSRKSVSFYENHNHYSASRGLAAGQVPQSDQNAEIIDPVFEILQQSSAIRLVSANRPRRQRRNSSIELSGYSSEGNNNDDNTPHPSKPNVKFLDNTSNPLIKKFLKNTETPYIVLYSFTPLQKNDLELYAGEIITVTDSKDEGWWLGKNLHGKTGYFPAKFVMKITPLDQIFRAIKPYKAIVKSEMSIKLGQILICATTQPANKPGYLYAKSGEREGYVLEKNIELIEFEE